MSKALQCKIFSVKIRQIFTHRYSYNNQNIPTWIKLLEWSSYVHISPCVVSVIAAAAADFPGFPKPYTVANLSQHTSEPAGQCCQCCLHPPAAAADIKFHYGEKFGGWAPHFLRQQRATAADTIQFGFGYFVCVMNRHQAVRGFLKHYDTIWTT